MTPPSDPTLPTAASDPRDALFDTAHMQGNLGRRAGRASVFVLLIAVLKVAQQIGSIAIIARLIPPADYGIYAMALPGVMIAMALSNFGLPQAIVQRRTITHDHVSALFWMNIVFAALVTAVLFLLSGPAGVYYSEPRVVPVFQVVSLSLVFSAMSSQYLAILQRTLQIRASETLSLAAELLGLAVAIAAAWAGASYWALVLQQIVTPLLKTVLMARKTHWWPSWPHRVDFAAAMGSVSFGGFVAGYAILNRLTEYVGTVITGGVFDAAASGLFYRARSLAAIAPKRVMIPLSGVFVPVMSRLQDQPAELRRMFNRLISRANLILLPIAVLMAAGATPLVAVLLGPDWMAAAPLMLWMSAFTFREAGGTGLQFAMVACGQSRPLFVFSAVRLALIAAVMVVASRYGLVPMTAAYMLIEVFVALPLMVWTAHRHTPISGRVFLRACLFDMIFAVALALALIGFLVPRLTGLPGIVQLAVIGLAIAVAYAGRIGVSAPLRADVLRVLQGLAGKLLRRRGGARG